ncbi:MAG: hypothetical protein EBT95_07020 [Verrucomicrobia bacterium]|nr:hypothetical protein [Verrucomicrobiota bacterium]
MARSRRNFRSESRGSVNTLFSCPAGRLVVSAATSPLHPHKRSPIPQSRPRETAPDAGKNFMERP